MVGTETVAAFDNGSWVQLANLAIALVLAATIGLERELRAKSAGLRTHTIVGVGAALFVLISKYGFDDVLAGSNISVDPSRVAAGIVTGIGFIGGGLIFVKGDAVRGLTTAATVWMAAAVGAAAGAGMWLIALVATLAHLVIVYVARLVEARLPIAAGAASSLEINYEVGAGAFARALEMITDAGFSVARVAVKTPGESERKARVALSGNGSLAELAAAISELPGVLSASSIDATLDLD